MKEKIKDILVAPNSDYVVWAEDLSNIVRDTTLMVSSGCVALYIVNGVLKSINIPGRSLIKSKAEEKDNSKLDLICVNVDKVFEINCGVSGIPFKDSELNYETAVGGRGECKIRITQPWPLYAAFGRVPLTVADIAENVKLKLNEIMTSRLAEVLQHYDYNSVMTQQSTIATDLEKRFMQSLGDIGLEVVSFALAGIVFSDEYQEKRKEFFEMENQRKAEKQQRREKEREQRAEIDNIIAIANATKDLNPAQATPVIPQAPTMYNAAATGVNQGVKYCSSCGTKMDQSAAFCSGCGKKF